MFAFMDEYTEKRLWEAFEEYDKLYQFLMGQDVQVIDGDTGDDLETEWIKLATRAKTKMSKFKKDYLAHRKAEYEAYHRESERKRKEEEALREARDSW